MRNFWIWHALLFLMWLGAMLHLNIDESDRVWRFISSACFFAMYFSTPLLRNKPFMMSVAFGLTAAVAVFMLWPFDQLAGTESTATDPITNPYALLIFSILAGTAVYRLPGKYAVGVGITVGICIAVPTMVDRPFMDPVFVSLYAAMFAAALTVYKTVYTEHEGLVASYDGLKSEHRNLRRRLVNDEATAREQERAQIARDIHDSVGHKLTALFMQLEVFRLQSDDDNEQRISQLKQLAKESLEETRTAVRSLKEEETGGLSAILRMIRALEAESVMQVQFSVKHGALSVPLSNKQSVAIYRVVQEALTNVMRHGKDRQAVVTFEAPGGSVFRFEIANSVNKNRSKITNGFGLQAMRERMQAAGGQLDIRQYDDQFIVRGSFMLGSIKGRES